VPEPSRRGRRDLSPLLHPRSVAVVGASSTLTSLAGKPVRFLRESGADVAVYPVNPTRSEIGGYTCYPDPASLPEAPDVGLVVVPAAAVVAAVEALAVRGARSAIVVSSGFAESGGPQGAADQRRLGEIARTHGMALLGPNTLGVHDYVRGLPLSFVWYGRRASSSTGSVAVVSQSGSGMTSLCDRLLDAGLPLGHGIATGNEADVTVVDALEHFAEDPSVKVIVAMFEEVRDGPRFLAVLRRLRELGKPLVALKVGRTESGSAVVRSHTGALAGSYPVLRSLLRQHGVLEVTELDDLVPMTAAAVLGKLPSTDGFAVVTSSGGAAAMSADRADEVGDPLADLGPETQRLVAAELPSFAQGEVVRNPIDVTAQSMQRRTAALTIAQALVDDPAVGAVVYALPSGGGADGVPWTQELVQLVRNSPKPVVSVILSGQESDRLRGDLRAGGVPVLSSPARAVDALHALRRLALTPVTTAEGTDTEPVVPLPNRSSEHAALAWLGAHGVPVVEPILAADPAAAVAAADKVGYPVAVKISSPDIAHKTEVGGVVLGCADAGAVEQAATDVLASAAAAVPDAAIEGVTVTRMITPALELIAGVHRDPAFGPVILLGLGGIWAEVLADVTMRALPLADGEVERMIDDLRAAPLLRGARGRVAVDTKALTGLMQSLARIARQHGDHLVGVDLNPVAVTDDGSLVVLDASIFVEPDDPADGPETTEEIR
jgi:acyl-CoA synthetase (NDP forming)